MRPRTIQPARYLRLLSRHPYTRCVTEPARADPVAVLTRNHQRREIAPGGADTDYVAARPGVGGRAGGRGSLVGRRARAEPPGAPAAVSVGVSLSLRSVNR
jgi:hypothetical protein